MSYLGTEPNTASFNSDVFSGDGSTTGFTMSAAPGSSGAVIVTIDGVKQHTSAYSVSGVTLTFTAAPPSGTNNIEVIHLGVRVEIPQVAADSITQTEIATGSLNPIVQLASTTDSAVATGTTTLPLDDTIPQNTEGTELMTCSITPTSATNKLIIDAIIHLASNTGSTGLQMSAALFQDSTADALAAGHQHGAVTNWVSQIHIHYEMTAGTTSATTFKIRAGTNGAATYTFNGSGGTRHFGGVYCSGVWVTEVQQ